MGKQCMSEVSRICKSGICCVHRPGQAKPVPRLLAGLGPVFNSVNNGQGNVYDTHDPRSGIPAECPCARWFRRPAWRASSVLQLPLTQKSMQRLLRFRTGCHGLPRDVGGHQGVPRRQRICPLCAGGLGDEMHLVFECTALQDLRVSFAPLFRRATTMQQFMWQPDLMRVAQAGVRTMQGIDPSDGSDIWPARLAGTDVNSCLVLSCPVCGQEEWPRTFDS